MNQDLNNLNQNNFNTQSNNDISNNQPLNNQNFNQNINANQQINNNQPQTINTFENVTTNNESFNSKPPKKMNLGLIIGIILIVAVVGIGVVFGAKLFTNKNTASSGSEKQLDTVPKDYISIKTIEDYAKLLDGTYDLSKNYILMNDLDLKDYCTNNVCKPIGGENGFTGIFNGNNHIISNYSYNVKDSIPEEIGFFGRAYRATIKNVIMKDAVITLSSNENDYEYIGILVGEGIDAIIENCNIDGTIKTDGTLDKGIEQVGILAGKITTSNDGEVVLEEKFPFDESGVYKVLSYIRNCNTSGAIQINSTGEIWDIGGLIGAANHGFHNKYWYDALIYINRSIANVDITIARAIKEFDIQQIGGFIGRTNVNYIYQCGSEGNVSSPNGISVAGFIGKTGVTEIRECYSTSKVLGGNMVAGFISSFNDDFGATLLKLTDCYFTGDVSIDTDSSYAIPKSNDSINSCNCASFIYNVDAEVTNAYSSAAINYLNSTITSGKPFVSKSSYDLENTYYDSNLLNDNYYRAISKPLTTEQMKQKSSYISFDFDNVWTIDENNSTPRLRWQSK